jgi:glycosyltransferase involved in cell wall biosynthesis
VVCSDDHPPPDPLYPRRRRISTARPHEHATRRRPLTESEFTIKIGILSQWYEPEPGPCSLPGVLARGLMARGHEVRVLTGYPNYPQGRLYPGYSMRRREREDMSGIDVMRVALYPNHDRSTVRRGANYASFALSALASGMDHLRGADVIWVHNNPILISLPMWFQQMLHATPVVLHVMDLWPDIVLASEFATPGPTYALAEAGLMRWTKAMYSAATSVVYISPGVGAILAERGVPAEKLHYVPVWADEDVFRPSNDSERSALGIADDQVTLLYAGAIGEQQGLDSLIRACALVDDPRFVCLIAGTGVSEQRLRRLAEDLRASSVRFLGQVPRHRMTGLMATGDIHYVGLRRGTHTNASTPSKMQATLAAARPMIVAAEGDAVALAQASGAGTPVDPEDPASIAAAIRGACARGRAELRRTGQVGRAFYEAQLSTERGVEQVEHILTAAAESRSNGAPGRNPSPPRRRERNRPWPSTLPAAPYSSLAVPDPSARSWPATCSAGTSARSVS